MKRWKTKRSTGRCGGASEEVGGQGQPHRLARRGRRSRGQRMHGSSSGNGPHTVVEGPSRLSLFETPYARSPLAPRAHAFRYLKSAALYTAAVRSMGAVGAAARRDTSCPQPISAHFHNPLHCVVLDGKPSPPPASDAYLVHQSSKCVPEQFQHAYSVNTGPPSGDGAHAQLFPRIQHPPS